MRNKTLDVAMLRKLISYDPASGTLYWLPRPAEMFAGTGALQISRAAGWNARFAGTPALNADNGRGYRKGTILWTRVFAHRAAWAIYHGQWPASEIDHIDGNPSNNAITNLRAVTHKENGRNTKKPSHNKSGVVGVHWSVGRRKWIAQIGARNNHKFLGHFDRREDAIAARAAAELSLGYHKNHGREKNGARM